MIGFFVERNGRDERLRTSDSLISLNHFLQISLDLAEIGLFLFVFLYCEGLVINMSARFCNSLDEITFLRLPELS